MPDTFTVISAGRPPLTGMTELDAVMDFDHVIRVDDEGNVHDDVTGVYAPDVHHGYPHDDEVNVSDDSWSLVSGYSGQDRYSGPIMHPSEYVGGGLQRHILETPGYWVVVVVYDDSSSEPCEVDGCDVCGESGSDDNVSGWAVAYREVSE